VIVEGRYQRSGVFESTNLMVKHSNEYRAPRHGRRPPYVAGGAGAEARP
jgi:cytochrome c-type biogenesis protein CcmE